MAVFKTFYAVYFNIILYFCNCLGIQMVIRKLKSGKYRLYSRSVNPKTGKKRNLGTFGTKADAEKHERAVQFFKHRG
jgi:hypothetical protein